MSRPTQASRGITLLEIVLSIAIFIVVGMSISQVFAKYKAAKNLDAAIETVHAAFAKGYFDSISSKSGTTFGVRIATSSLTVFQGQTYVDGTASNVVYDLPGNVEITSISLAGGGSDVLFSRLAGTTSQSGTFDVGVVTDSAVSQTLTIQGTGTISQ